MTRSSQKNSWWAKVVFDEFASHFFGMDRDQIADDIQESVKKVLSKDGEGNSFGAFMVRIAEERIARNREARVTIPNERKSGNLDNVKIPSELIYGKFENVYLTQDNYNDLLSSIGNFNELKDMIENLSAKLEDGSVQSDNHFATLTSWIQYRKKKEEDKPRNTFVDHNTQVFANGLKYLEEKYGSK